MRRNTHIGLATASILLLSVTTIAQQAKSKAEYDAYKTMYDEQDQQQKSRLAEAFLDEFSDSDFTPATFQLLANSYVGLRNWRKVVETAEKFDQYVPDANTIVKGFMYQRAMAAAEQSRDNTKVVEFGEKVLEVDRNNLGALLTLSTVITDNLPEDESNRQASLSRVFQLANRARIQAAQALRNKPQTFSDDQWAAQRAAVFTRIHMTLGVIHYNRGSYEKAVDEYKTVLQYNPRDPFAYLQLGLSYEYQAAGKSTLVVAAVDAENDARESQVDLQTVEEMVAEREGLEEEILSGIDLAIDSLAKAVALGGEAGNLARVELEKLYLQKNKDSLEGLEELIEEKRLELNQ